MLARRVGANRALGFLPVLVHHPGLKGIDPTDDEAPDGLALSQVEGPLQGLDLKPPKACSLVGADAVAQGLSTIRCGALAQERAGEGSSPFGARLLQNAVRQALPHQCLHPAVQSPEASFNVEQGHACPAKQKNARAVCIVRQELLVRWRHRPYP